MKTLTDLNVGDGAYFKDGLVFIIRAKGEEYLIATLEGDGSQYTIIDTEKEICGPNDHVFNPYDYTKQDDVDRCLRDLLERGNIVGISKRNGAKVEAVLDMERTLK